MSTNSANMFSVTDDGRLTETPKCTRTSPCSKADCLFCNGPASNHHVRDLTEDLENSIPTSRSNKPTVPADHWISNLTDAFKDAIMDHDIEEMIHLNIHYLKMVNEAPDLTRYNHTELKKLSNTAKQTVAAYKQVQAPIQPPPPLQAFLQYENQQTGNSYLVR